VQIHETVVDVNREAQPPPYGDYGAIAAVSCAVLLFEVLVTRILSVTLSYHFAFLTISLAMLGLAAPGVWFSLEPPRRSTLFIALYASAVRSQARARHRASGRDSAVTFSSGSR
jgi:hypothetical protein